MIAVFILRPPFAKYWGDRTSDRSRPRCRSPTVAGNPGERLIPTGSSAHFLSGGNTGTGVWEFHFLGRDTAPTNFKLCRVRCGANVRTTV